MWIIRLNMLQASFWRGCLRQTKYHHGNRIYIYISRLSFFVVIRIPLAIIYKMFVRTLLHVLGNDVLYRSGVLHSCGWNKGRGNPRLTCYTCNGWCSLFRFESNHIFHHGWSLWSAFWCIMNNSNKRADYTLGYTYETLSYRWRGLE